MSMANPTTCVIAFRIWKNPKNMGFTYSSLHRTILFPYFHICWPRLMILPNFV